MTTKAATGPFEVKLNPEPLSEIAGRTGIGRMSLDKLFRGDLEATSQGEMLAFRSAVQGSAGYVAMETVNGILHGRPGSFVLQHSSTMTHGVPSQSITVVPGSGSGKLTGISGTMTIDISEGLHAYHFSYFLDDDI
jgi:hypothetical protein